MDKFTMLSLEEVDALRVATRITDLVQTIKEIPDDKVRDSSIFSSFMALTHEFLIKGKEAQFFDCLLKGLAEFEAMTIINTLKVDEAIRHGEDIHT